MRARGRSRSRIPGFIAPHRQRGNIVVNVAISLSVILILLVGTELGYLFYAKREMQKAVDLAAVAAVQEISRTTCGSAQSAAVESANGSGTPTTSRNLPAGMTLIAGDVQCGRWDASFPLDHFIANQQEFNAAQVTLTQTPALLLPGLTGNDPRTLSVRAIATFSDPIASFSVATGVVDVNLSNQLLNSLLGTGTRISLDAISYQGLASTNIKLADLVSAVPTAGSVSGLLSTQISVGALLQAMSQATDRGNTAAVSALNGLIAANVAPVTIRLGDLLKISALNPETAAAASINLFDMLTTAAQISNGTNVVALNSDINLGALATAKMKLAVVQPPSIAIGRAGKDAGGAWVTQAHAASMRLFLDAKILDTSSVPGLSPLLKVSLLRIPIYIDVAPGNARLTDTQCAPDRADRRVSIEARTGLANICIGEVSDALMSNVSAPVACNALPAAKLSEISLLGGTVPVVRVDARLPVQAEIPEGSYSPLVFNGVVGDTDDTQRINSNAAGSVLSGTLGNFTDKTRWVIPPPTVLGFVPVPVGTIAAPVLDLTVSKLAPLFSLLDSVVVPMMNTLGIQLGYTDTRLLSLTCSGGKIVY